MDTHHMDQEQAECLLVGPVGDAPQQGPEVLIRLLAAVRSAPRTHELSGEAAAVRGFRAMLDGSAPVVVSPPAHRFRAGWFSAKVTLAALLAATTAGVAVAATTGARPWPSGGAHDATATPSAGTGSGSAPAAGPHLSPAPDPSPPTPAPGPSDRPGRPASLAGLCTAYRAQVGQRRHPLEAPPFADLVSAAGGPEKVAGYCDRLLDGRDKQQGPHADPTERSDPDPPGQANGRP
ncbi:hypothetical protein [Micromonospora sp. SL4-19]|uniref:hypothetical protein n=1 Tax=Micromonospora sp. SL4-19 TaxID=3399129 RepID=UPI003A4DD6DE